MTSDVSIVLYVHNGELYLQTALDSIVAQTHTAWELCVVDDGSTDATPSILAQLAERDHRVRIERQDAHGRTRLHETFNACVAMTQHDLIAIANADDVWEPDKLARQVEVFAGDPTLDVCHHDATFIDGEGRVMHGGFRSITSPYPAPPPRPWQFVFGNPIPNPTVMFHRSMLRRIGLQETGEMHDHQFWFKATVHGCRFHGMPDRLIRYRVHERSHSTASDRREAINRAHRESVEAMVERYRLEQLVPEVAIADDDDSKAWAWNILAINCWTRAYVDLAVALWKRALSYADNAAILCGLGLAALLRDDRLRATQLLQASASAGVAAAQTVLDRPAGHGIVAPPEWHGPLPAAARLAADVESVSEHAVVPDRLEAFDASLLVSEDVSDVGLARTLTGIYFRRGPSRLAVLVEDPTHLELLVRAHDQACRFEPAFAASLEIEVLPCHPDEVASIFEAHLLDGSEIVELTPVSDAADEVLVGV